MTTIRPGAPSHADQQGARLHRQSPCSTVALVASPPTPLIFSVVNAVLLRPLPFRDESRVVRVGMMGLERRSNHSAADFLDLSAPIGTLDGARGLPRRARGGERQRLGERRRSSGCEHVTCRILRRAGDAARARAARSAARPTRTRANGRSSSSDEAWQRLFARRAIRRATAHPRERRAMHGRRRDAVRRPGRPRRPALAAGAEARPAVAASIRQDADPLTNRDRSY